LWVWGRGEFGVLGFTNTEQRIPVMNTVIEEMARNTFKSNIKKISSCSDFSSILFDNGRIFSFGNND
jgi:alpha-tubulin suppressor-like RCC1 family protein